jgi:4-amino-4-deoxy-L-arabinose transferase-like glycosyltransferase
MGVLREKIRIVPGYLWLLVMIIIAGVFLRTYGFHDFLRFNADQSRDAGVVSSYLEGTGEFPLLGPKAGGTDFRLGNAFYVFQIASAKVFGNEPDKMAYPDLLFSIIAIPLLYLFLRKYFDVRTSLLLSAVFAVSFYAVKYSRFAWNPNALPLWTMLSLYALHEIAVAGKTVKWRWVILAGFAIGVAVQLHTLALVFFPIMVLGTFGFLLRKKQKVWGILATVILVAALLNAGQIGSEWRTGGSNTKAFIDGIGTKERKGEGYAANLWKDAVCHVQGNAYILSSYDRSDECETKGMSDGYGIPFFVLGFVFTLGGIVLAVRSFRRETDPGRKYFLGLFLSYCALSFLVLLPLANEISMRFFLVAVFMPFVLLGLWFDFLSEKLPRQGMRVAIAVAVFLIAANLLSVRNSFAEFSSYLGVSDAGMDNVLLKEVELASAFVVRHAGGAGTVALDGDAKYLFKALKSMEYFTEREGIRLVEKKKKTDPLLPVFLIENSKRTAKIVQENPGISEYESLGRFTIFRMR